MLWEWLSGGLSAAVRRKVCLFAARPGDFGGDFNLGGARLGFFGASVLSGYPKVRASGFRWKASYGQSRPQHSRLILDPGRFTGGKPDATPLGSRVIGDPGQKALEQVPPHRYLHTPNTVSPANIDFDQPRSESFPRRRRNRRPAALS
jgi:hypothetical protein